MKINKTLIILSLLLVFCISLGAVSAADNTDISVNDINDGDVATVESSVNVDDEISTVSEEGQINKSSEIYDDIKSATGTYNITTDYQIDKTWEIPNANVIIEGNNHTIYGNGKRAFNITGNNVTIKNLNFLNCSASNGGAIYWEGAYGSVSGCTFINTSASGWGGAMDWSGDYGAVSNCTFINTSASGWGGAMDWSGDYGNVSGCTFINTSASSNGGAMDWSGDYGSVSGCTFINTSALNNGGAMDWSGDYGSVSGCTFINTSASSNGGAIYWYGGDYGGVSGCTFINTSALDGGVIFWAGANGTVSGCNFINSSASSNGGAIYWEGANGTVSGCSFINSSASSNGGAIYWYGGDYGGVSGCSFINSSASSNGGAIYWHSGDYGGVSGCSFVNCSSNGYTGAIHLVSGNNCSINYCIFEGNSTNRVNDIYVNSGTVNADFNFFGFQNNVTSFPKGLVSGVTLNSWVVLNIANSSNDYFVDFVLNDGSHLNESMPDYTARLTIYSVLNVFKDIIIKNNNYVILDRFNGNYVVSSLNTGNVLVSTTLNHSAVYYEVVTFDCDYGGTAIVTIKFSDDATGNVTVNVDDGQVITRAIKNGYVSIPINHLSVGVHNLNISYSGNEGYIPFNTSATVTVSGSSEFDMNVSVENITYGQDVIINVTLPTDAIGYVELYINGKYYGDSGVRSGVATFNISGLTPNKYNIKAVYSGDNKYSPYENVSDFVVNKIHITVTPTALSTTYDSGKYFQIKVVNSEGKAVSGLKLSLKVYTGSSYSTVTVTTDANGIAKYSASKLSIATHKVVINVPNTNYFVDKKTDSSIKVSKAPTTITAKKVTYRKGAKKYFSVTIKNKATGKVVKSLTLKIKVYTGKKYKTYTVKTNSKGIAKLSTRYLKRGTHKVVISTTSKYYAVSKSGKLIVIK